MRYLPLANLMHHKLRSLLSALGIGISICMLVTLSGLSRGILDEVADRWESVQADAIVTPLGSSRDITMLSGMALSDRYGQILMQQHGNLVRQALPVALVSMKIGGQDQMVAGVDSVNMHVLTGSRKLHSGRLFDPELKFTRYIEELLSKPTSDGQPVAPVLDEPGRSGLEMVIDSRLAKSAGLKVGDTVKALAQQWTIVGIVQDGGMARVYVPRRTVQWLLKGSLGDSSIQFISLQDDVQPRELAAVIRSNHYRMDAVALDQYRGMLRDKFSLMYLFVHAVNIISLTVAFLFIMVTLYTMVIQQTREIAILKSCGASSAFVMRQVLGEAMLLSTAGVAIGLGLSLTAQWAVETFAPLYTVTITWHWVAIAVGAAVAGAAASSLYPAWRATRVDMVSALTYE